MDRLNLDAAWFLNLGFAHVVPAGLSDEMTLGSVWAPGVIEELRFSRIAVDLEIRAYILPGRVPTREGLGSEIEIVAPKVISAVADASTLARQAGIYSQTVEDVRIPIGVVVPWECWSLVARVDNPGGVAREVYGHFVVRVLAQAVLPVPAFWERERAPHLARFGAHSSHTSAGP